MEELGPAIGIYFSSTKKGSYYYTFLDISPWLCLQDDS